MPTPRLPALTAIGGLYARATDLADAARPAALLATRLLIARVFLLSGLTKWAGLSITPQTYDLFRSEFFAAYKLPDPLVDAMATAAAIGEIVLPILLILGLFTRFAALGLLAMTVVIQLFVFPDAWWTVHAFWAALLAVVIAIGPGAWSLDRLLGLDGARA